MLMHEDIENHVASFRRLLDSDSAHRESYILMLGEWVIEKLMEQEEFIE